MGLCGTIFHFWCPVPVSVRTTEMNKHIVKHISGVPSILNAVTHKRLKCLKGKLERPRVLLSVPGKLERPRVLLSVP